MAFLLLLGRLVVALYLLSSALAAFDRSALPAWEIALRLGLAALVMARAEVVWVPAVAVAITVVVLHARRNAQA